MIETGTESTCEDHVAHDWNFIHDLLHGTRDESTFGEVFKEFCNSSVLLHEVETSSDDSIRVGIVVDRLPLEEDGDW